MEIEVEIRPFRSSSWCFDWSTDTGQSSISRGVKLLLRYPATSNRSQNRDAGGRQLFCYSFTVALTPLLLALPGNGVTKNSYARLYQSIIRYCRKQRLPKNSVILSGVGEFGFDTDFSTQRSRLYH